MNYQTLLDAQYEAERFLRIVEAARMEHSTKFAKSGLEVECLFVDNKLSGALRRSSMDLTRKLADLRQNR